MKLFTDNRADSAIITDASASINYPPSNVKNSLISRIYKSGKSASLDINAGGGLKSISEAYTNLVQDPTDLTTGNWILANGATVSSSSETVKGFPMSKIGSTTAINDPQVIQQNIVGSSGVNAEISIILRNLNYTSSENVQIIFVEQTPSEEWGRVTITFGLKTVVLNTGHSIKYKWYDDDTVEVSMISNLTDDTDFKLRIDPDQTGDSTKFFYATSVQIVNNTKNFYPFISGTKSADIITESFTMPDRFTFDMIVEPFFQYDTAIDNITSFNFINGSSELLVFYQESSDQIQIAWVDGGTARALVSQQFDDGTSFTNINQKLRVVGSLDLKSGGQNDSRFIVIPLESGAINEDTSWSGTPDIKSSVFDTLYIGNRLGIRQADANYEYLRIYGGLLVGSVTSSDDVTELLKDKTLLFDKTYQSKITATDLLLANTTIRDGDTVTLQANDVDSWGTGTPLYETVVWRKGIITHNFTKSTYQYYRLSVNSSNDLQIGRLYLGEGYSTPGMSPTVTDNRISASVKSTTPSGQSYMDERYIATVVNTTWPSVTHVQKAEIFAIFYTIDVGTPFFITFDESCSDLGTLYVTMDLDELSASLLQNPAYYTIGLTVREEV